MKSSSLIISRVAFEMHPLGLAATLAVLTLAQFATGQRSIETLGTWEHAEPTGVAVSAVKGRLFLSFPR